MSSHVVRGWQIDYTGSLPPIEGFKYAFICVDAVFGLLQDFSCLHESQAATVRRLGKLSTMCRYPHQIDSDWRAGKKENEILNY